MSKLSAAAILAITVLSTLVAFPLALPDSSQAQSASAAWSVQEVLTDGAFGTINLVLDSNDNPHIVHSGANGLMYYTYWDGTDWQIQEVIQGGTPIILVLDSSNKPHILYKGANDVTYYASLKGQIWEFQIVPQGNRYSFALDSVGNPHLVYAVELLVRDYPPGVTNNVAMLNYAVWNGSGWNVQTVDKPVSRSDGIYLALDSKDKPRIMYGYDNYYPASGGFTITAKFASWTGSSWNIQTALPNLDHLDGMALDSKGYPHFIYGINYPHESIGNVTLGYASWNGASWSRQTAVSGLYLPGLTLQANLALDSHDNPHIEFFNGSLMYASWTGANWALETVAPDQFASGKGPLALNSRDRPSICYWVNDIRNTTAFVSMLIITTPVPMFRQGPLPRPAPSPSPLPYASATQLWKQPLQWSIVNSPTVKDGFIYVTSGGSGSGTQGLYCLNAFNGAEVWRHNGLFATFTVADGYVYVGAASYSPSTHLQGVFSCLNASTGAQLWNHTSATSFTTPVVQDGIVYVCALGYTLSTDVNRGSVYAFNVSTGEKIWEFSGPERSRFDFEPLILQDGSMYVLSASYSSLDASWQSGVYAFNAQTGEKLWDFITTGRFDSLVADARAIFVSSDYVDTRPFIDAERSEGYIYSGGVLAIDALSGSPIWSFPMNSSVKALKVKGDAVYAVSGEGIIYAFNAADGGVIWSYTAGTGLGDILLVDDYLFVGSSSGAYCFNAHDGSVIWKFAAIDLARSAPTFPTYSDGIVYLGWNGPMFFSRVTQHGFYAISAADGKKLWNYTLACTVTSTPAAENGTIYVGCTFVSSRSPDHESNGVVLALKTSIASMPLPSAPLPASPSPSPSIPEFPSLAILTFLAAITLVALSVVGRKKTSGKSVLEA